MKINRMILRGSLAALLLLLHAPAYRYAHAGGVKGAKRKIDLKITYPDGKWVKARSTEGSLIRLERDGDDFAFTPNITDADNGEIEVSVSRFEGPAAKTPGEALEKVKVKAKTAGAKTTNGSFTIEVFHIGTTAEAAGMTPRTTCLKPAVAAQVRPVAYAEASPLIDDGVCCASCEGITACANCSVWIGCGATCCVGECCGFAGST